MQMEMCSKQSNVEAYDSHYSVFPFNPAASISARLQISPGKPWMQFHKQQFFIAEKRARNGSDRDIECFPPEARTRFIMIRGGKCFSLNN